MTVCPKCREKVTKLTKDHIIPKSLKKILVLVDIQYNFNGKHNIEMICKKCNLSKSNSIDKRALRLLSKIKKKVKKENIQIPEELLKSFKLIHEN